MNDTDHITLLERKIERMHDEVESWMDRADKAERIVDQFPKCWRLVDGKLVQDVAVVPGMVVWTKPAKILLRCTVAAVCKHERRSYLSLEEFPTEGIFAGGRFCFCRDAINVSDSPEAAETKGGA